MCTTVGTGYTFTFVSLYSRSIDVVCTCTTTAVYYRCTRVYTRVAHVVQVPLVLFLCLLLKNTHSYFQSIQLQIPGHHFCTDRVVNVFVFDKRLNRGGFPHH